MQGDQPVSWLMFFTLAAGVLVACGLFLSFLRSRTNREIAAHALQGKGEHGGPAVTRAGAGPELVGLFVIGLIAMGLLTAGYSQRLGPQIATGPAAPKTTGNATSTTGTAKGFEPPNQPQQYQPANPAPDPRTAPTGSTTGSGPDNGGRPEQQAK